MFLPLLFFGVVIPFGNKEQSNYLKKEENHLPGLQQNFSQQFTDDSKAITAIKQILLIHLFLIAHFYG